jgi:hypothetical protein
MLEKQAKSRNTAISFFFKAGLLLLLLATGLVGRSQPGEFIVVGVVSDSVGSPVPFASVVVEGQPIGVSTDVNGRFRISIPASQNATLTVSCVGYKSVSVPIKTDATAR